MILNSNAYSISRNTCEICSKTVFDKSLSKQKFNQYLRIPHIHSEFTKHKIINVSWARECFPRFLAYQIDAKIVFRIVQSEFTK